jgi:RHS repeat-associated protein
MRYANLSALRTSGRLLAIAVTALLVTYLSASAAYLPSDQIGTAALISTSAADSYYGTNTTSTDGLAAITGHATPEPTEIIELARALKDDPDLIYQYVHNNIQTVWLYGLQKGALGASIDKAGTAFDQAALMVEILRQAGFTATYQAGTITLSGTQFTSWTNISNPQAACQLLSSGGIPAQIQTDAGPLTSCATPVGTSIVSITLAHIWVAVTIPGSSAQGCSASNVCLFDPAFKPYQWKSGIANLPSNMGITPGATLAQAVSGMDTGSVSGVPYIHKLDGTDLNTLLQGYAANYLQYLKSNSLQGIQLEDVISGGVIIPVSASLRQANLPYSSWVAAHSWTGGIPDQYRTTLAASATRQNPSTGVNDTLFNATFFVDQIYGRRLTVDTNFNDIETNSMSAYNTYKVYLKLDDAALVTYTNNPEPPSVRNPATITLTANHPYAAAADGSPTTTGDYMDSTVIKVASLQTGISIVNGWGDTANTLFTKWSNEKADDSALPYRMGNYGTCETCNPLYTQPTGTFAREKAGASYLAQYTRAAHIHAALASSIAQLHHVIGIAYGDDSPGKVLATNGYDYFVASSYTRLDLDAGFSFTSRLASTVSRRAGIHALAATVAALEGSMSDQQQDIPDTDSTAIRFEWGNAPPCLDPSNPANCEDPSGVGPRKFFQFTAANASAASSIVRWEGVLTPPPHSGTDRQGSPQDWGTIFQNSLISDVQAYAAAGFTVVTPEESFLGPGQRGGSYVKQTGGLPWTYQPTKQRGNAFIASLYDANGSPTQIAHAVSGILQYGSSSTFDVTKGGGGATEPTTQSQYNPNTAADILKSRFVDRSSVEGVNLSTGVADYKSPVALSVGNGDFPYELSASLSYRETPVPSPKFGPGVLTQPQPGWTSSWNNNLSISGSGMEAMGQSDIRALAGTLAAFLAAQDVYTTTDASPIPTTSQEVAGNLVNAWWAHQLGGNVATVAEGASTRQFVKLATNSWIAPGPGFAKLVQTNNRAVYQYLCPVPSGGPNPPDYPLSRGWDYSSVSFALTNQHGDTEQYGYWVENYSDDSTSCGRQQGFHLNTWTFPQGPSLALTYARVPAGSGPLQLTQVANNVGRELTFTTSGSSLIIGDGGTRNITVGEGPTVASHTDANGNATTFSYIGPLATTATQRPVPWSLLSHVFTPDAPTLPNLEYDYDSEGRVNQVKDAVALQIGGRNPYTFFIADGTRGEHDDPLGQAYSVVYDTYGHPSRYIDELSHETDAIFDSRARAVQYLYPEGDCDVFAFDDQNNTTDFWRVDTASACNTAAGSTHVLHVSAVWDQTWNKPTSVTNARGYTTNLAYYPSGNGASLLETATLPTIAEGTPVYSFTYDSLGKALTALVPLTGSAGITTTNTYDPVTESLLTSTLDPGTSPHVAAETVYTYDSVGNVATTQDPRGNVTSSTYDANRNKTQDSHHNGNATAALNAASRTLFDALNRDYEEDAGTAFSGTTVTTWQMQKLTAYTPTSKVKTVTDADSRVTTTAYDNADRVLSVTDPVSRVTEFLYCAPGDANCAANAVKTELRAWSSGTACSVSGTLQQCYRRVTYLPDGEQSTIEDANNNTTTYGYDPFVRLTQTTFPDSTYERLSLDANGNVLSRLNRASQTLSYTYNALDWALTKVSPVPSVTTNWTWMLDGAVATLSDTAGNTLANGYDTAGRLTSVATTIPGLSGAQTVSYVRDANGNRTKLAWPDGYYTGYCYDNLNRMSAAMENATACTTNLLATYSYDPLSRRTNLAYGNGASMAYSYSNAGDLLTLNHVIAGTGNPQYTFQYTNAHQLYTEANTAASYVWQPSAGASTSYTPNALNQYTAVGSQTSGGTNCFGATQGLSYDCNGNLTFDGTFTYSYDAENRLLTASKTGVAAAYAYDPIGRRTQKSGTGVTATFYLDDGADEIAEYTAAGALAVRYIPGPAVDEPIAMVTSGGTKTYFHTNHQGSTVAMSGAGPALTEGPYTYDPYGNCFSGAAACSSGEPYRFTGQRFDPETGLHYYRARYYSAALGRFLQTDPVGYTADLNIYAYVGNDPVDMADPSGLDRLCVTESSSRIPSCVNVSGGEDKHTLTQNQIDSLEHDFRGFILAHNGQDITSNGAQVTGGSQSDQNFISAVSQFVGTAIRQWSGGQGWNGIRISLLNTIGMESAEGQWGHGESDYGYSNGNFYDGISHREIDLSTDKQAAFGKAGDAARLITHERLHWIWNKDRNPSGGMENRDAHQALDSQARSIMKTYGLSNGGCSAMGDYPACQ